MDASLAAHFEGAFGALCAAREITAVQTLVDAVLGHTKVGCGKALVKGRPAAPAVKREPEYLIPSLS